MWLQCILNEKFAALLHSLLSSAVGFLPAMQKLTFFFGDDVASLLLLSAWPPKQSLKRLWCLTYIFTIHLVTSFPAVISSGICSHCIAPPFVAERSMRLRCVKSSYVKLTLAKRSNVGKSFLSKHSWYNFMEAYVMSSCMQKKKGEDDKLRLSLVFASVAAFIRGFGTCVWFSVEKYFDLLLFRGICFDFSATPPEARQLSLIYKGVTRYFPEKSHRFRF